MNARNNNNISTLPHFGSLKLVMVICIILVMFNVRGGFLAFPEDNFLGLTASIRFVPGAYDLPVESFFNLSNANDGRVTVNSSQEILNGLDKNNNILLRLQPLKNKTIIVGLANKAYAPVAMLWYRRMTEAGFTNHRILAADKPTAWVCDEHKMRYDMLWRYTRPLIPSCHPGLFDKDGWRKKLYFFAARWIYVRQKLLEGYHVLMTDVDSVYNYMEPVLTVDQGSYDHYTAYADKMPLSVFQKTGFTICGCFNWMRSTPSMIQFLDSFLSQCGCSTQAQNNTCECGCDDQVTINSMLLDQLDMKWDLYEGGKSGEFRQHSMTGVSQRMGQRIKIADRSFVFRGHPNNTCSKGNWITFPKSLNKTETKSEQMNRLLGNCPLQVNTNNIITGNMTAKS
ncbi:nucleotide-diphospho-sugar transferase [Nitzschia inconspicua]|uniref:Nucleotide-diphospho-sugar transferase n=1 Tax=Nitzschia inconspicua TaxID=303405 RepID=A0A9K3KGF8_9STRA|nr:nucleotide-diphospho-sugar transferase [Nitzschia inconspicua]